jgi:ferritin
MMLVQYLLDADEAVVIPGVTVPRTSFADAMEPVALALAQERRVTDQISALATLAREDADLVAEQFMQWFLKEQLEEMSSMAALLKTVERAATSNLLLVEAYLARTTGGEAAPVAGTPRAAGGAL